MQYCYFSATPPELKAPDREAAVADYKIPKYTKGESSVNKKVEMAVTFDNVNLFEQESKADEPVIQGETKKLNTVSPTVGRFKALQFCPISDNKQGQLLQLRVYDLTKILNAMTCVMGIMLLFQLALEQTIRRMRKPSSTCYSFMNYNLQKVIIPENLTASAKKKFEESPTKAAREALQKFTVLNLHAQSHIFILHNIMRLIFNINYGDVNSTYSKIQPIWIKLGVQTKIIPSETGITVSPRDTFEVLLKKLNLSPVEKDAVITSVLMLYHYRELDSVFNLFTDNIVTKQDETSKEPTTGVECEGIPLTPFIEILIEYPTITSLNQNMTLWSGLPGDRFINRSTIVRAAVDEVFKQDQVVSSSISGTFFTQFSGSNLYSLCLTILDNHMTLALVLFTEYVMSQVTWAELYGRGFRAQPASTAPLAQKYSYREDRCVDLYKPIQLCMPVLITSVDLFTEIITVLRPGKETYAARIANIQKAGPRLEENHIMRKILEANNNLADRMISIINKCDRSLSAHRMKTVQPALMNGSGTSEVKSSVLLNDPVLSASAGGSSTGPDLETLTKDKLSTEALFPFPPQRISSSYNSEEECSQVDDQAYNPSNPGMQADPFSSDHEEIPGEKE